MISIMQRCVVVAIMVVAIAIGGKGGLALAGAPSIQSDDTGIVLRCAGLISNCMAGAAWT